ncbi:hypothetical protein DHEL01_v204301 [Diaporthe helianthi]|uniref:Uncharacterized protein n=1 Tax=Diaporthe helianthi TaxID=158607 RepID=A0A2P5I457_DIAHE|nr:hypothetical protein DHEL01_v204301 [Diaporthe helianthi]
MQPTKILITAMSLGTALAASKFDEVAYGVCQAICTRQALTCYDKAGVTFGSKHQLGTEFNITTCNVALDTCVRICIFVANGACDLS